MDRSLWLLLAAVLIACAMILGLRSCGGDEAASGAAIDPASSSSRTTAATPDAVGARSGDPAGNTARVVAMRAAVSTLHQYIAALPGSDRAKADAFWVGGKPPARSGEADLRTLDQPRALRLENGTPTLLGPTADALEIPVELRVNLADPPIRHYRGWYRMRRAISGDRWEITSASIDVVQRPE